MIELFALVPPDHAKGYARLAGAFEGPMVYFDQTDFKQKEFPIKMRIEADEKGLCFSTKFVFSAPRYQLSVTTESASADGSQWIERGTTEVLTFSLINWSDFCNGTSNWFQIERPYIGASGPGFFRRKYSVFADEIWSEKWVKAKKSDPFEFSHKMTLSRKKDAGKQR